MRFWLLGKSGLRVSELALGTMTFGEAWGWGASADESRRIFEAFADAGGNFVDTACNYTDGESERIIGNLLRSHPGHRERLVIATKYMPFPWRMPLAARLRGSLEASLERLGLPAVDLYQVHGPISLRSHSAMADALAAVLRDGLTRAVGVSNYSARETRLIHAELAKRGYRLASNQVEYSLLRTMPESSGLLATCKDLGVVLLAYSPIGQGRLTGKYSAANPPPDGRNFSAFPMKEIDPIVAELRRIGEPRGRTPSQVALNWLICKGTIPIPGAKNRAQAEQNAGALGWTLSADEVHSLDRLAKHGQRTLTQRIWQHG